MKDHIPPWKKIIYISIELVTKKPVLRDHTFMANKAVLHDRFHCSLHSGLP